jgi:hypothetical protein
LFEKNRHPGRRQPWPLPPPIGPPRPFRSRARVDRAMGDAPYRRCHENQAGGGVWPNNPPLICHVLVSSSANTNNNQPLFGSALLGSDGLFDAAHEVQILKPAKKIINLMKSSILLYSLHPPNLTAPRMMDSPFPSFPRQQSYLDLLYFLLCPEKITIVWSIFLSGFDVNSFLLRVVLIPKSNTIDVSRQ